MITVIQLHVIGEEKIHCAGCEIRIGYALRCAAPPAWRSGRAGQR